MREVQMGRFKKTGIFCNAHMKISEIKKHCGLEPAAGRLLKMAIAELGISARAYHRILKVARTVADMDGSDRIEESHVAEAIQYRSLDRRLW
ncbi:MAG: hypothetical protein JW844_04795 [Candidatus Omnitrophica bacterium]|nr:hypothetical protein [Candidatus Omnitrophota bacterium]